MEKIRKLATMLQAGIEDYEKQMKLLQEERLKFLRLSITDGFGNTEDTSRESWLLHMKNIEDQLKVRVEAMQKAILDVAAEIQTEKEERENIQAKLIEEQTESEQQKGEKRQS